MICRLAVLALAVLIGGCKKNATLAAYERAAAEVPLAEAEAKALGIKWLPEAAAKLDETKTAKYVLGQGMKTIKPKLRASLGVELELYELILSSDSAKVSEGHDILAKIEAELDSFVEASKKPSFGYKPGPEKYYVGDKDIVSSDLKEAIKLLSCRAIASSMKGDTKSVLRDVEAALRLSTFPRQEGTVISVLWGGAVMHIVLRSIEWTFTFSRDPLLLRSMAELLTKHTKMVALDQLLKGEPSNAYFSLSAENIQRHLIDPLSDPATGEKLVPRGVPLHIASKAIWARYLQGWCRMVANARSAHDPAQFIERQRADEERVAKLSDPSYRFNIGFGTVASAESATCDVARIRCVLALARALQHRKQHGRWPTKVSEADPFNDRPLKFKFSANTAVIYSIGRDFEDDGGKEPIEDVVARFPLEQK